MSYEKVKQAKRIIVGTKQTVKALNAGKVQELVVAENASQKLKHSLIRDAEKAGVTINYVDSMKKLGKTCGISVGAAAVAILK